MKIWKITEDILTVGSMGTIPCHVGTWGDRGGARLFRDGKGGPAAPDVPTPVRFRIIDDDGEVYYHGEMTAELADSCDILLPLDDFATPNDGATDLEIMRDGEWILV